MTKDQMRDAANLIDSTVSSLCDVLDFEEGDSTDETLDRLLDVAVMLRRAIAED